MPSQLEAMVSVGMTGNGKNDPSQTEAFDRIKDMLEKESFEPVRNAIVELASIVRSRDSDKPTDVNALQLLSVTSRDALVSFIEFFTPFSRFCGYEKCEWFNGEHGLPVCCQAVTELLNSSDTNTLAIETAFRLIYIIARSQKAFAELMEKSIIPVIVNRISKHICDPTLCQYAMLAIGNATYQLECESFDGASPLILSIVLDVAEKYQLNESTLEPAMWALSNVYFSEVLEVSDRVVALLRDALKNHSHSISVVCEACYCAYNIACKTENRKQLVDANIITALGKCFANFRSERFAFPAIEVLMLLSSPGPAHIQKALDEIMTVLPIVVDILRDGYLEHYEFGTTSSDQPKGADFRKNYQRIIRTLITHKKLANVMESKKRDTEEGADDGIVEFGKIDYYHIRRCSVSPLSEICARKVRVTHGDLASNPHIPQASKLAVANCSDRCQVCQNWYTSPMCHIIIKNNDLGVASFHWPCSSECIRKLVSSDRPNPEAVYDASASLRQA